ncbi:MAG TPA: polysaccharide deacetylase family protein [Gemmatimonadaceae bacterium]|jgi:peptidoglycan/xylan/chitin deacetylase (PgdA/CDA1 family)|nr:polysaccharide deacetylase family protein [Gemmatimonadaceae bacterium]
MIGAAAAGIAAAGLAAHGAWHRNSFVFGPVVTHLPGDEPVVSITFDDGPNPHATPRILDILRRARVTATFFVLGRHVERWPELVRRMAVEGHQLGNHGYFHRKLHRRSPTYVRDDITRGTEQIVRASGVRPRLFRAPHGFRSPWVTPIAASLGQRTVGWSLGVWDSALPGAQVIASRAIEGMHAGSILLLHDGDGYDPDGDRSQTADALPSIIEGLRGRGFRFTTLPE